MKQNDSKFIFAESTSRIEPAYKWYKISVATYLSLMCSAGFVMQQLNPKGVHGYFDFYSNCIETSVTIWSLLHLYLVQFPDSHAVIYAITNGFNAIAVTASSYLCFCYWAFSPVYEFTLFSTHQHIFLCAVTFVDLLINCSPLR